MLLVKMISKSILCFLLFCFVIDLAESKVVLVHTVFRHGERAPDAKFMYPTDPYKNWTFFPYGSGELTDVGKNTMYKLGKELRHRYSELLGDYYFPDFVDAWTGSIGRTQVALQTLLAGLFPPDEANAWNKDLKWEPIAYNALPKQYDTLILSLLDADYVKAYNRFCKSNAAKKAIQEAEPILAYIRKHSGLQAYTPRDFFFLYITLITEEHYELKLPLWTKQIFPQPLTDMIHLEFELEMATKELRRLLIGRMLRKILVDTEDKISEKSTHKIHLYSAHDVNVAYTLMFFDVMYKHAPGYASCIAVEVHEEDQNYYIELHYRQDKNSDFKLLLFKNGNHRLNLNDFRAMVNDLFENQEESGERGCVLSSNVSRTFEKYMTVYQVVLMVFYYKYVL